MVASIITSPQLTEYKLTDEWTRNVIPQLRNHIPESNSKSLPAQATANPEILMLQNN
jgi:hypothetical protein